MTNGAFTPETAREAGLKSAEARRRRRDLSPAQRAAEAIDDQRLVRELQNAAFGEGDFQDLKLETRVTAMLRLMEWKLGRPGAKPPVEDETPVAPATGDDLFT